MILIDDSGEYGTIIIIDKGFHHDIKSAVMLINNTSERFSLVFIIIIKH